MNAAAPSRRTFAHRAFARALAASVLAATIAPAGASTPADRRAVELTFLKSNPGERERLKTFIVLYGFAMDKIAKEQGLMSALTVMDTGTDQSRWNVLVSVTSMNEKGYEGLSEAFERIRRAHATVRVEGKTLRELGTIVDSKRVFEDPAHATR